MPVHYIKFLVLIACLTISTPILHAQSIDSVYIGMATLIGGSVLTYKLQLTDSNGTLKGYSVMDVNGEGETKASITGTVNASGNQILFREKDIVYSKSAAANPDFCIMQGSLKMKKFKGAKLLKGHFEGYLNGGKILCASGKLVLISPKDIFKMLGKPDEDPDTGNIAAPGKDTKEEQEEVAGSKTIVKTNIDNTVPVSQADTTTQQLLIPVTGKKETKINPVITYEAPPKNVLRVQPGKSIELDCTTNIITLEVWDNKDIDGDIITLMQGDIALIKNYILTGTHYAIPVKIGNNPTDTLRLIAVSEGTEPMNTARIKITSGSDTYFIDATTTIDKEVLMVLRRK